MLLPILDVTLGILIVVNGVLTWRLSRAAKELKRLNSEVAERLCKHCGHPWSHDPDPPGTGSIMLGRNFNVVVIKLEGDFAKESRLELTPKQAQDFALSVIRVAQLVEDDPAPDDPKAPNPPALIQ